MYFNESHFIIRVLNVASVYDDTAYINGVNTTANIQGLGFVTGAHTTDTHIQGDGYYLTDNFVTMFFNESRLNKTVENIIGNFTLNGSNLDGWPYWVNLSIDANFAYFKWNQTNNTLELWVNSKKQQDWGASTRIFTEATFFDSIFGDGSTLLNVCLPNGSTVNGAPCNATSVFYTDEIWINNINGNATFNASKLNQTIQAFITASGASKSGGSPWLYNDSTTIYFNESLLNLTVKDLAEVKKYEESIIVTTSGGVGGGVSSQLIDFQITRITVVPDSTPSKFRFQAYEQGSLEIIDKDRIPHTSLWDIEKSHAINNEYVVVNITSAVPDRTFNVTLTYLDNFRP